MTVSFATRDLQTETCHGFPSVSLSRGHHGLLPASSWPSCFLPLQIVDFALLARPNWEETEIMFTARKQWTMHLQYVS